MIVQVVQCTRAHWHLGAPHRLVKNVAQLFRIQYNVPLQNRGQNKHTQTCRYFVFFVTSMWLSLFSLSLQFAYPNENA